MQSIRPLRRFDARRALLCAILGMILLAAVAPAQTPITPIPYKLSTKGMTLPKP